MRIYFIIIVVLVKLSCDCSKHNIDHNLKIGIDWKNIAKLKSVEMDMRYDMAKLKAIQFLTI